MDEETEKAVAENIEALAFVDRAIRMDKEKFLDLSRKINDLIESLQKSGANPVTVYYLSRAIDQYATDKMSNFGRTVEENRPDGSDLNADALRKACVQLFAVALEDAAKMSQEEQQKLVDEHKAHQKRSKTGLVGYA
jgi:hypothetical protein